MRRRRRLGTIALVTWLVVALSGCDTDGNGSPFRNLGKRGDSGVGGSRPRVG
jgi:hypothetical protein